MGMTVDDEERREPFFLRRPAETIRADDKDDSQTDNRRERQGYNPNPAMNRHHSLADRVNRPKGDVKKV